MTFFRFVASMSLDFNRPTERSEKDECSDFRETLDAVFFYRGSATLSFKRTRRHVKS